MRSSGVVQQKDCDVPVDENKKILIYPPPSDLLPKFLRERYEKDARKYWDLFYKRNANKFFKDRHYLDKEWGVYFETLVSSANERNMMNTYHSLEQKNIVLEVGCGVGNTVFPLLANYSNIFIHACDFSSRAIELLKAHDNFTEKRIHAFVCDVTCDDLASIISGNSVDVATMVFMLSSISPGKMANVIQNIKEVLKLNGHVLVRDYAAGDLAQERLSCKMQRISDNFYARGDGTRAFYFTEAGLCELFEKEGFSCEMIKTYEKTVENRAKEVTMERRWIQGAFRLLKTSNTNATCYTGGLFGMPDLEHHAQFPRHVSEFKDVQYFPLRKLSRKCPFGQPIAT